MRYSSYLVTFLHRNNLRCCRPADTCTYKKPLSEKIFYFFYLYIQITDRIFVRTFSDQ